MLIYHRAKSGLNEHMNRADRKRKIRLANLRHLVQEAGTAAVLAGKAETDAAYLSQLNQQRPTKKGTPRSVGEELAEKLETAMGKEPGWMDIDHDSPTDEPQTKAADAVMQEDTELKELAARFAQLSPSAQAALWTLIGEIPDQPRQVHIAHGKRGKGAVIGKRQPKNGKKDANDTP